MARAIGVALLALAVALAGALVLVLRALDRRGEDRARVTREAVLSALGRLRADLAAAGVFGSRGKADSTDSTGSTDSTPPPALH